ncbi:protein C3orf33 homolog isoform X1 [Osmerus mordax]|uniref:protein C3orf33 homolog isoform X1 n=1 Tax=Osmerus mordax TaxID=8014 RepID=UPI003510B02F
MPETRLENPKEAYNIVSVVSKFADDHLNIVRKTSAVLAIAGLIVISRSIKLITKFNSVSEIPAHFIEQNVSLRGRVKSITEKGLEVEHIPIHVPLLSTLLTRRVCSSRLAVHLAGVELTPEARLWMEENLSPTQVVWLRLLSRDQETLHCLVSLSTGSVWARSVNEELLKLGLARTVPVWGLPPQSRLYWRLHKRLLQSEVSAERKRRGLWKEDSQWEKASRTFRENRVVRFLMRLFKWT